MQWLAVSLVLSVVLTVLVNVVIRLFPHQTDRAAQRLDDYMARQDFDDRRNVRVFVPWKAMLVVSLILTIAINVLIRL